MLRPHGVQGELLLQTLTDYPERIGALDVVYLTDDIDGADAVAHPVVSARRHRGSVILRLGTVHSCDQAEAWRDAWVLVALEDAVPLENGEYYLFQLIGLEVVTVTGETLGVLEEVIETGANDVYIVRGGPRGEVLVPAAPHVVREVNFEARRVTVDLPDGLLS